jgi:hypothetical protein
MRYCFDRILLLWHIITLGSRKIPPKKNLIKGHIYSAKIRHADILFCINVLLRDLFCLSVELIDINRCKIPMSMGVIEVKSGQSNTSSRLIKHGTTEVHFRVCCLTPYEQMFSYIMARASCIDVMMMSDL